MSLAYPELAFTLVVAAFGSIYGVFLLFFYRKLDGNPKMLMAKFKLNGEKTVKDFKALLVANIGLAFSLGLLAYSSITSNSLLLNASYVLQIVFSGAVVATIGSWVIDYVFS